MFFLFQAVLMLVPIGLFVGVVVWAIQTQSRRARRVRAAVPALAQMGFSVEEHPNLVPRFPFSEFAHSNLRMGLRIARNGAAETAFQYQYVVGVGNNRHTVRRSCAIVPISFWAPDISVSHGGQGIVGALDPDRVESDSAVFNSRYRVRSRNERFAYTTLSYEVIEWFLHAPPMMLEATVRMNGPWLMLVAPQFDALHLPQLLGLAETLRSQLPPVLTSLYPFPAPPPSR